MKQIGEEIQLSETDSDLIGLPCIPVRDAATVADGLYGQSVALFKEASSLPTGTGMTTFTYALDLLMAAGRLVEFIPAPPVDAAELIANDITTYLENNT